MRAEVRRAAKGPSIGSPYRRVDAKYSPAQRATSGIAAAHQPRSAAWSPLPKSFTLMREGQEIEWTNGKAIPSRCTHKSPRAH